MLPSRSWLAASSAVWWLLLPAVSARIVIRQWVVNDWVTVGGDGVPNTIKPTITTVNGAASTVSPPPSLLTGTIFAVTSDSHVSTSTGSPPPPMATAKNGAGGTFAVCNNKEGTHSPLCQPGEGSELSLGKTYYVTWDPTFFANDSDPVSIEALNSPSRIGAFDSVDVPAKNGFVPFTVEEMYLSGQPDKALMMFTISFKVKNETKRIDGPRFSVVRADISVSALSLTKNKGSKTPLGTILGVVFGLLVAAGIGWFLWRRYRQKLVIAGIRRRSSQGYGVGKGRTRRMGGKGDVNIQLDEAPASPNSGPPGQNVFRQEILRQERERT